MAFAHLHCHTDASLKDGLGTVMRFVEAAARVSPGGAVAMTDHGSLANAISFTQAAKQFKIKPLLGLEAYLAIDGQVGHVTLLADGNEGFHNLTTLNNIGHASKYKQPAFELTDLLTHNKDIVVLSGCQGSPFQKMSLHEAVSLGSRIKSVYGHRFFVEAMAVNSYPHAARALDLAGALNAKIIITNDAHFPYESDADIHHILTQMKAGFEYDSQELWLKTQSELKMAFRKYCGDEVTQRLIEEGSFVRTAKLASYIREVKFSGSSALHLSHEESMKVLRRFVGSRAKEKFGLHPKAEVVQRLRAELDVINKTGYADYFLIIEDLVSNAKKMKVKVGPGRGSGAGSLVLYTLGVTDINPLDYDLSFERFLNVDRIGMPDVDIDFDSERREKVIEYAKERYGALPIATYSRYSHKSLIHDLAKTMHISRESEAKLAHGVHDDANFRSFCEDNKLFSQAYEAFIGQIRHKGKHAGGVIITKEDVPIERAGDSLVAAWTEGKVNELSYVGITKFDLLSLSALTALRHLEEKLHVKPPKPHELSPSNPDYKTVFNIFKKGDLAGIFQFSGSDGIRELCMNLGPECFEDLIALNALYRPGAIDVGTAFKYPEWKKSPRILDTSYNDILAPTYGVIVYQEQVMAIIQRFMGGSLAQADTARRTIVKTKVDDPKWVKSFEDLKAQFIEAASKTLGVEKTSELWDELAAHSRYSFNKAHATAYAQIAWETAWWKAFYKHQFYAEMLNTDLVNTQLYIYEAISSGAKVMTPHIQYSTHEYTVADGKIFMPLHSIKFLGFDAAKKITEERQLNGPFVDAHDMMRRIPKSVLRANARLGLYALGGLNLLEGTAKVYQLDSAKVVEASALRTTQMQSQFLGMYIPDAALVGRIERAKSRGYLGGIISEISERVSKFGPYKVFRLAPHGTFWTRDFDFRIGEFVIVSVSKGKLKAVHERAA